MNLFESLTNLAGNVAKAALAPVEVAVDLADVVVQPIAEAAEVIAEDIKSIKETPNAN